MLKTRNIFIDTQTFVANNFFENENFKRLSKFGELETIKIYLTEITVNEIKSNIKEDLQNAQNEINRFKKSISGKIKVLKNIEEYKNYVELPNLKLNIDFEKINKDLDDFIDNGKVTNIPYENVNLNKIVNSYFNEEKPFGKGKKKHEFPDAIVLSAIEEWCEANQCKIYIISDDKDMKEYVSERLIPIPKLRLVLDKINNQFQTDKLTYIKDVYSKSQEIIKSKIKEKFIEVLEKEYSGSIKLRNTEVEEIILYDESIVQNDEGNNETIFELDVDISYTADAEFSSFSLNFSDDDWDSNGRRRKSISDTSTSTVEISLIIDSHDNADKSKHEYSINCTYCSLPNEEDVNESIEDY